MAGSSSAAIVPSGKKGLKRTFLFQLTDDEIKNPSKLVSWCDKIPAVAKTNSEVKDEEFETSREHFKAVMDLVAQS